jgi:excisionase family DNA binding protein
MPPATQPSRSSAVARLAFSVSEAAQMLGVSDKTVRRLIDRKLLRVSRALRHLRIPKTELDRFLKETCS